MKRTLLALALVAAFPVTALAGQCPAMQAQIDKALGNRFDASATNARFLAKQADDLHKSGKHAESMKKYDEAAEAAKLKLEKK